jgi:hypothetical protein
MNQTASQAGTGKLILGGRVAGNRSQSFVAGGTPKGASGSAQGAEEEKRRQAKKSDRKA